jgi:hypothetical protein
LNKSIAFTRLLHLIWVKQAIAQLSKEIESLKDSNAIPLLSLSENICHF